MLTIHRGNRLERLKDRLAEMIGGAQGSIYAPLPVVVPNRGMQRWLALEMATRNRICASVDFPLPAPMVWRIWREALPELRCEDPLPKAVLRWCLYRELCDLDPEGSSKLEQEARKWLGGAAAPTEQEARKWLGGAAATTEQQARISSASAAAPAERDELPPGGLTREGQAALRCFETAGRIAETFDEYLVFRPDLILGWEAGGLDVGALDEPEAWQAELWRRVASSLPEGLETLHRARVQDRFKQRLRQWLKEGVLKQGSLPERLFVFAVPALAPVQLNALEALAQIIPVDLFTLDPCLDYWLDDLSERDLARTSAQLERRGGNSGDYHLDSGHPLLSSCGLQGRDALIALGEIGEKVEVEDFEDPLPDDASEPTLLRALQSDILNRRGPGMALPSREIPAGDDSIRIHACHSPMREVEVLQDQLLHLFRNRPDLSPHDVRVLAPDIESYVPFIQAVFGAAPRERFIPFALADRRPRAERPLIEAFLGVLELPACRWTISEVLRPLELPAGRARRGLDADEVKSLRRWLRQAGVRWGLDADHRGGLGLPADAEHTWAFGLDRLLLGVAMESDGTSLFEDILPTADVEGIAARVLGPLEEHRALLVDFLRDARRERSIRDWQTGLSELLDLLFLPQSDEERSDVETLRARLAEMAEEAGRAGVVDEIPLTVVRAALLEGLDQAGGAWAFLDGKVTFCTMTPLRNVPARVVYLLGLEDTAFPRQARRPHFDLIGLQPKLGDRARRDDDRYLFLEALLSARDVFQLSYVGKNIRTNDEEPASVVVGELLEALALSMTPSMVKSLADKLEFRLVDSARRAAVRRAVVVEHPLHAFSRRYFEAPPVPAFAGAQAATADAGSTPSDPTVAPLQPSFATELREALSWAGTLRAAVGGQLRETKAFVPEQGLGNPRPELRTVSVARLATFLRHPVRFFLNEVARIDLRLPEEETSDIEPFDFGESLERYVFESDLVQLLWEKKVPRTSVAAILRAGGRLPHGAMGEALLKEPLDRVAELVARIEDVAPGKRLGPVAVDIEVGGCRIVGSVGELYERGRFRVGLRKELDARDALELWVHHLILQESGSADDRLVSLYLGTKPKADFGFAEVDDPRVLLEGLVKIYLDGLVRPSLLVPALSLMAIEKGGDESAGGEQADEGLSKRWQLLRSKAYSTDARKPGKLDQPEYQLAYRGRDPLATETSFEEFVDCAEAVFGPLKKALKAGKKACAIFGENEGAA